jgi:hypothetical protein
MFNAATPGELSGRDFVTQPAAVMKKTPTGGGPKASQRITDRIAELGDWRGQILARLREVILDAAPNITEEWKWGSQIQLTVVVEIAGYQGGRVGADKVILVRLEGAVAVAQENTHLAALAVNHLEARYSQIQRSDLPRVNAPQSVE